MTDLLGLLEKKDLIALNVLTSWLMLLTLRILRTLLERTSLLKVDDLTS